MHFCVPMSCKSEERETLEHGISSIILAHLILLCLPEGSQNASRSSFCYQFPLALSCHCIEEA